MSDFNNDLKKEQILAEYLDASIYPQLGMNYTRISDINSQYKGIDFILKENGGLVNVDEKAQLTYINKNLPTFAFEISYFKNEVLKEGWLNDKTKETEAYFLITGIQTKDRTDKLIHATNIHSCTIHRVNRQKLTDLMEQKGLSPSRLNAISEKLRAEKKHGKQAISELHGYKEGNLFFTHWLPEKPVNLVLKLQFLIDAGVAKKIR